VNKLKMTGFLAVLTIVGLVAFAPRAAHAHGGGFHGGGFHGGFRGGGFHGGGFHGGGFHGGFHAAPAAPYVGAHFAGPRGYVGPRLGVVGPRYYHPGMAPRFGVRAGGPGYWGWHSGVRVWFGAAYPGPGWSWVPAHWEWNGVSWYWESGYWAPPVY
jgi:hypothetical protein